MRREGRLTPGQQRALEQLWPQFGLACAAPLNFADVFGRTAPVTLEIGSALTSMLWKRGSSDFMDYCTEIGFSETPTILPHMTVGNGLLSGLTLNGHDLRTDLAGGALSGVTLRAVETGGGRSGDSCWRGNAPHVGGSNIDIHFLASRQVRNLNV